MPTSTPSRPPASPYQNTRFGGGAYTVAACPPTTASSSLTVCPTAATSSMKPWASRTCSSRSGASGTPDSHKPKVEGCKLRYIHTTMYREEAEPWLYTMMRTRPTPLSIHSTPQRSPSQECHQYSSESVPCTCGLSPSIHLYASVPSESVSRTYKLPPS